MRILHTSDWHLGQTFHDFDRSEEHEAFLSWLLATLETERPDALLIAGDIFDTANPSAVAQQQFYRFITRARAALPDLGIVAIAGNHDSPGRLEATAPFMDWLAVTVVGLLPRDDNRSIDPTRLVVPLRRRGRIAAWCLALPFLRAGELPHRPDADNAYLASVTTLYEAALAHACTLRSAGQPIIAMGHCHMRGGAVSERSERSIVIGGSEALPASIFGEDIAYAALGHLHRAQTVDGKPWLRYSGSPLPMSFAEQHYPHQVLRVDFEGAHAARIEPLAVPRPVDLLRIPARPAPLDEVRAALATLDVSQWSGLQLSRQPYLEVRVRLDAPEPGLRHSIETALEGKPLRLARIDTRSGTLADGAADGAPPDSAALDALTPERVFARLCESAIAADTADREDTLAALGRAFAELASGITEDDA